MQDHQVTIRIDDHDGFSESSAKRRRLSPPQDDYQYLDDYNQYPRRDERDKEEQDREMSISATSRHAGQNVATFLARHIPSQYAPLGGADTSHASRTRDPNSKYCYRHRPDLKCRRQADDSKMDQLQHEVEAMPLDSQQAVAHVWSLFSAAPAKQRILMLSGILSQCCFPQLSYLAANVRELVRIDFLSALPAELSFKVLCFLDTTSLCKAAQVSQRWRTLADDDVVWHKMCEQHIDRKCTKCGWGLPLLEKSRLRASKRQIQLRATGQGINEWSPNITPNPECFSDASTLTPTGISIRSEHDANTVDSYFKRPWKDIYKDRFKVGSNWRNGRFSTKLFRGHTNGVMCLQFDSQSNILATGSYDATIKIWDIERCQEIRTLRGHTSGVRALQFDGTKLISGSLDKTLKIWNWHTGECISTYTGHNDGVIGLHFDSSIVASASMDHTILISNFKDKEKFFLRGHRDWVNAVKVDSASGTVLSASDDFTAGLWDLQTRSQIKTFEGHVGHVQQVIPLPREFEYQDADDDSGTQAGASSDTSQDEVFAAEPCPAQAYGPGFSDPSRPLPPRHILTSSLDSTIRLWDTLTGKCLRTYFGHVEGIWALSADKLRILSAAEDRMAKVWDLKSATCERTFTGHSGPITCCALSDESICTGSEDAEVRMYSFQ